MPAPRDNVRSSITGGKTINVPKYGFSKANLGSDTTQGAKMSMTSSPAVDAQTMRVIPDDLKGVTPAKDFDLLTDKEKQNIGNWLNKQPDNYIEDNKKKIESYISLANDNIARMKDTYHDVLKLEKYISKRGKYKGEFRWEDGSKGKFAKEYDTILDGAFNQYSTNGKLTEGEMLDKYFSVKKSIQEEKDWLANLLSEQKKLNIKSKPSVIEAIKANKGSVNIGEMAKSIKSVTMPKPKTDLSVEAKKYKSAEEFVRVKVNSYHGSNQDVPSFDINKTIRKNFGDGVYMTDKLDVASKYAINASKKSGVATVIKAYTDIKNPFIIDKNTSIQKIKELTGVTEDLSSLGGYDVADNILLYTHKNPIQFSDKLKKLGYDGIVVNFERQGNKQIIAFKDTQIKTKSQLEKIWQEANK